MLKNIMANLKDAAFKNSKVQIGIGIYSRDEIKQALTEYEAFKSLPEIAESILEKTEDARAYLQALEELESEYPYIFIEDRPEEYDLKRESLDKIYLTKLKGV